MRIVRLISFLLMAWISFPVFEGFAGEAEKPITLEELSESEAAQYYFKKRYSESLQAFQKLESEHPQNLIIKRYLAILLIELNRPEEASAKLKEILRMTPEDSVARQKLSDLQAKERKSHLQEPLKKNLPLKVPAPAGPKNKKIEEPTTPLSATAARRISAKKFVASHAARDFSKGNYQEALQGFESMKHEYPEDVLVRRFYAVTLLRMGRVDEALKALQEANKIDPGNAAVRYYLGMAYLQKKEVVQAKNEFQSVIEKGPAEYRLRAERALKAGTKPVQKDKRWGLRFLSGYEFDTNATYKSQDSRFSESGDQNTGRYPFSNSGYYRFFNGRGWAFTADGFYSHNINHDFPNLNTYTYGLGVAALYSFRLQNRPAFLNFREGAAHTFLKNRYYSWSDSLSTSFIHDLTKRLRITVNYRWSVNEYALNGTDPDRTNRDGISNSILFLNTFFLNARKTVYATAGYEYEYYSASGANFIKHIHGARTGIHMPVIEKIQGDVNFYFEDGKYPKYGFEPPRRRDEVFTLSAQISRPLFLGISAVGSYIYEASIARNNIYEYAKSVFGGYLVYKL